MLLACFRCCSWVLMVPAKHLPRFNARQASGSICREMFFHNVCYQTILIAPIQRALAVFPSILLGGDDGLQCIGKDQIRNSAGRLCNVRRGLRFCRRNRLCGIGCGILRFQKRTAGTQGKAQREQKNRERDAFKNQISLLHNCMHDLRYRGMVMVARGGCIFFRPAQCPTIITIMVFSAVARNHTILITAIQWTRTIRGFSMG